MILLLLVEDELLVRVIARDMLREDGFEVLEAKDGDAAIKSLDALERIDIIVTDVRMPGRHDGVDVAFHARARFPQVPIIVVTGFAANIQERLKSLEPQPVLLGKPYSLEDLAALAQSLTSGSATSLPPAHPPQG